MKKHCIIQQISASKKHKELNYAEIQIDNTIDYL